MKLRNKKTGEILGSLGSFIIQNPNGINCGAITKYDSLAELNEEWEDYEEPKVGYIIDPMEEDYMSADDSGYEESDVERAKELGIWLETKEEAENVVKKLRAWKQLKDNCNFRFNGIERDERGRLIGVKVEFDKTQIPFDTAKRCHEILDLLFGGEE